MLEIGKFNFFIISISWILLELLDLEKFLDLDLGKFQLFNLAKTLNILFSLFFIFLHLLLPIFFFSTIFIDINK